MFWYFLRLSGEKIETTPGRISLFDTGFETGPIDHKPDVLITDC